MLLTSETHLLVVCKLQPSIEGIKSFKLPHLLVVWVQKEEKGVVDHHTCEGIFTDKFSCKYNKSITFRDKKLWKFMWFIYYSTCRY